MLWAPVPGPLLRSTLWDVPGGLHLTRSFADIENAAVRAVRAARPLIKAEPEIAQIINVTGAPDAV